MAGYHLRQGRLCDQTSSMLLEATVFFKLQQYDRFISTSILDQLEQVMNQKSLSICNCYSRDHIYYSNYHVKQLSPLSVSEILLKPATCMIFPRSDLSITPEALQYEMFRSIDTPPGS